MAKQKNFQVGFKLKFDDSIDMDVQDVEQMITKYLSRKRGFKVRRLNVTRLGDTFIPEKSLSDLKAEFKARYGFK